MDEHEEKERFRRAFSPLRASGGVLTEVFEMTTRKERRAPRAGKRLLVIARTAALALKLAEREIHKDTFGEYPVMLLDDVLSELDPLRQEYVLNRIAGGQVFITCCENDRLDTLLNGKVFHVKNGEVL